VVGFWFIGFALNLVLNIVFLPGRGAYIASLSSSIAYALLLALHMVLFAREAGGYDSMRPRIREVGRFVRVAFSRSPERSPSIEGSPDGVTTPGRAEPKP
jgi:hypothetical protein